MPRKARKYVNASFFHVMCQGIKKENIFSKESHIKRYLYLINKYKKDFFIDIIAYCVMPNHVHMILVFPQEQCNLSAVVGSYKSYVSKMFHVEHPGVTLWQRSFYDHVIRDEAAYLEIKRYIRENPLKWNLDEYNPNV